MDKQEPQIQNKLSLIKLMRKMSKITDRAVMNLEENKIKEIIRQKKFNKDDTYKKTRKFNRTFVNSYKLNFWKRKEYL